MKKLKKYKINKNTYKSKKKKLKIKRNKKH